MQRRMNWSGMVRTLVPLLLGTALLAQELPLLAVRPGGENGGGTGIWILPRGASYQMASGSNGVALLADPNGGQIDIGLTWHRHGDDLWLALGGSLLANCSGGFVAGQVGGDLLSPDGIWFGDWLVM